MSDTNSSHIPGPPTEEPHHSAVASPITPAEDAQWAMLSHFLNIILLIPALIIYLIFKDRGQRVAVESKEALNWTINITGIVIVANILNVILSFIPVLNIIAWIVLTLLIFAAVILNIIFAIIGGMRVKDGGSYRYPMNYRWIK